MNNKRKWGIIGLAVFILVAEAVTNHFGSLYDILDFIIVAVCLIFAVPFLIKHYATTKKIDD